MSADGLATEAVLCAAYEEEAVFYSQALAVTASLVRALELRIDASGMPLGAHTEADPSGCARFQRDFGNGRADQRTRLMAPCTLMSLLKKGSDPFHEGR